MAGDARRSHVLRASIALAIVAGIGSPRALALERRKAIAQYNHQVWTSEDGLPHNTILTILQTRDGYLWFGGYEGLTRFNGSAFAVFDRRNTPQLRNPAVQALCESRDGSLWIGTQEGLYRLKNGHWTAYTTREGLGADDVLSLAEDRDGALWIGTSGSGLIRFKGGALRTYTTADGLTDSTIQSIHEDGEGSLWIGTNRGLNRLRDGKITSYGAKDGLASGAVAAICHDREGNLWIGTDGGGLNRLKGGVFSLYTSRDGLSNNVIASLHVDRDGNLWIGTFAGGLNRFVDGRFERSTTVHGLTHATVRSLWEDREGSLWVGTIVGAHRLKDGLLTSYTSTNGLSNDFARAILEDREGTLWIATSHGLDRLKDGAFRAYTSQEGLGANYVVSIAEDRDGTIWIGTLGGGLSRFLGHRFRTYDTRSGLAGNSVRAICPGRDGSLWIGTTAGLNRLREGRIETYGLKDGLASEFVAALYEDRSGTLWIGTADGVSELRDGRIRSHTQQNGFPGRRAFAFYEDQDGVLWIGTNSGLVRRKQGQFRPYTMADGLFDHLVFQILEDARGNLWMSCNQGIFRARRSDFDDFDSGRIPSISCVSYGPADGMKTRQCNGNSQPAGWKTRDGRLWFPTAKGVVTIDPEETVKVNREPPPVVIEQLVVDQEPVALDGTVVLPPGRKKLEFHYAGLSFLVPEKVRFRYQLEGFEQEWVEAGTHRTAYYTNIGPGRFRFRVLACNNDGVWNEQGASVELYLRPFFWQTLLFYVACLAAASLGAWGLHRLRTRQLRLRNALLTERDGLAQEIHDHVSQIMTGLILQLDAARDALPSGPDAAQPYLERVSQLARAGMEETRRTVRGIQAMPDGGDLAEALRRSVGPLVAGTPVQVDVKQEGRRYPVALRLERELFRVGQEAVTNALRHGLAQRVEILLGYENDGLRLSIRDDGRGFDPDRADPGAGLGLRGMRERVAREGGSFDVQSRSGGGTLVEVFIPR